jgi:hypothetical protein
MRRRYQLSKIGKEKRKSGLCRLCGVAAVKARKRRRHAWLPTCRDHGDGTRGDGTRISAAFGGRFRTKFATAHPGKKRLPQVGQIPAGAPESEPKGPAPPSSYRCVALPPRVFCRKTGVCCRRNSAASTVPPTRVSRNAKVRRARSGLAAPRAELCTLCRNGLGGVYFSAIPCAADLTDRLHSALPWTSTRQSHERSFQHRNTT